jgi:hypothetical protein
MKTNLILLLVLTILVATACQEQINVEKEKEAIIAVVNAESNAYIVRDFEKISSCMVQDSLNTAIHSGKWGYSYTVGWEKLTENYKEDFGNDEEWARFQNLRFERKNFNIKVYPKNAWAIFNTVYNWEEDSITNEWEIIDTRILEKVDGEWKITYVGSVGKSSYKEEEKEEAEGKEAEAEVEESAE